MKGIVLPDYNTNFIRAMISMKVEESETPLPKDDQVLIRIDATPCNPSDIAFIRGMYNVKKTLPKVLGFEGTGKVIKTGSDEHSKSLLGKRVSCFSQADENGTWANFFLTNADNCIVLDERIDIDQAACFFVNPFTAYALFDICLKRGIKSVVQNAATGQIGKFIRTLAKLNNINVINIVRKPEHIEVLNNEGEEYNLDSSSENFEEKLNEMANSLKAKLLFDAVGGEMTGTLINQMPEDSEIIVYGGLSGKQIGNIEVLDIIFKNKIISGFNLNTWRKNISKVEFDNISSTLQKMIIDGKISTNIHQIFKLEDFIPALKAYIGNMSAGKIIFKP